MSYCYIVQELNCIWILSEMCQAHVEQILAQCGTTKIPFLRPTWTHPPGPALLWHRHKHPNKQKIDWSLSASLISGIKTVVFISGETKTTSNCLWESFCCYHSLINLHVANQCCHWGFQIANKWCVWLFVFSLVNFSCWLSDKLAYKRAERNGASCLHPFHLHC